MLMESFDLARSFLFLCLAETTIPSPVRLAFLRSRASSDITGCGFPNAICNPQEGLEKIGIRKLVRSAYLTIL